MERFIAQKKENNYLIIENSELKHFQIKRIKINEVIEVFYQNKIYQCQTYQIQKNKTILKILKSFPLKEPKNKINIIQSVLIQLSLLDEIIYKIYEAGAYSFTPIITKRSYQKKDIINQRYLRWQKIIESAFKQTRANYFLKLNNLINFENLKNYKNLIVLDNYLAQKSFKELNLKNKKEFNILIGPEGGFSENEILYLKNLNCQFLKLKPHILKSQNAGFIIASLILNTI